MELYRIEARKATHGWVLESKAFGITVDAGPDELDAAMDALKRLMADDAERILGEGGFLPAEPELKIDAGEDGVLALYLETDFGSRFLAKTSETVRRNISMPAWMDLRLRKNGIDASRLFQDAATEKLAELEHGGGFSSITDISDLVRICPERVLDEYFRQRVMEGLGFDAKREER